MADLKNFGFSNEWGFIAYDESISFVDNHDNQRSRYILTYKQSRLYKIANAFMLAWPYGFVRVMSSYDFGWGQEWQGPPSDSNGNTKDVKINTYAFT